MNRDTIYSLQFRGHLQMTEDKSSPIVATVEFEIHNPTSLKIEILLIGTEKENRVASSYLRNFPYNHLRLQNEEFASQSVDVWGIQGYEVTGLRASIAASLVQIGISKEPIAEDTIFYAKAELTPSGILVQPKINELFYTGESRVTPIVKGRIEVPSRFGVLEVGQRYAHYHSEQFGNDITHSVERVSVTSKVSAPGGENVFSINERIEQDIRDICRVLSFCYRQPVRHYEIEYFRAESAIGSLRKRIWRRRLPSSENTIKQDELINYRNLVDGGLERLLRNFQNAERADEISRVIDFLSASYKMVTLESSYFLAYSALDLVASIYNPNSLYLLKSGKWKKLERTLREYIDSIADGHDLAEIIDSLKQKLPELRRASGDSRILEACNTLNVNTSDLWPIRGFENGLKSATGMRNDLFHSALAENAKELFNHLVRVRTLVERLLLKILDWPDDQIWVWYDQNLKQVNIGPTDS
ncbi:MAG TPA: hypothetical protein VEM96_10040 [Pyrinomonadaceae bacterium]|nr:hypothetical protein [Pyrinomonadaceae bacterium]